MKRRMVVRRHRPSGPLHHLGEVMLDDVRAGLATDVLLLAPASVHRPPCHFRATLTGTERCPTVSDGTQGTGSDQAIFKFCLVAATGQLTFSFFAKVRVAGSNPVVRSKRLLP